MSRAIFSPKSFGLVIPSFEAGDRYIRECTIYNCDTKEAIICQFNPSDLPRDRSVNYATITSPGMAYPLIQFVNGEAEDVDIQLFLYDREDTWRLKNFENFIEQLLPPKHNSSGFKRPPMFKFYYGNSVENYVLVKKSIESELLNEEGEPYSITYTLTARRV